MSKVKLHSQGSNAHPLAKSNMRHDSCDQGLSSRTFTNHIPKWTALYWNDLLLASDERACTTDGGPVQPQKGHPGEPCPLQAGSKAQLLAQGLRNGVRGGNDTDPDRQKRIGFFFSWETHWVSPQSGMHTIPFLDFIPLTLILLFTSFSTPNSHLSIVHSPTIKCGF